MIMPEQHRTGYLIRKESLQDFIRRYRLDVRQTLRDSSKSIIEKHNCYTDWILTLLYFATGHRPVTDPFCYAKHISLEDAWCLIDDKVVEEVRRFRLVPLPTIAVKQLKNYFLHLKLLAVRLSRNKDSAPLGRAILSVLEQPDAPVFPLFFYFNKEGALVEGVGSSGVHKKWEKYIRIPKNEGRRSLASGLRENGVESELVRILLGHEDGLEVHFDYLSRWSPKDAMSELSIEIDTLLELWGFQAEPSFLRDKVNSGRLKVLNTGQTVQFGRLFGPEKRLSDRNDRNRKETDLVRRLIDETKVKGRDHRLSGNAVKLTLERTELLARNEKLSVNNCLYIAHRFLQKGKLDKEGEKQLRARIPMKRPLGHVHEGLVSDYRSLVGAREKFLQTISSGNYSSLDSSEKVAFISISAVLTDYLVINEVFNQMAAELAQSVFRVGDLVVGDFFLNPADRSHFSQPSYRWVPGGLSRALLVQLYVEQSSGHSVNALRVDKKQKELLKALFPELRNEKKRKEHLFRIAKSGLFVSKHPLIRTYYEEESGYTSVPAAALERVVNGARLNTYFGGLPTMSTSVSSCSIKEVLEQKSSVCTNNQLFKKIKNIFRENCNTPNSGNNKHRKQLKKVLRKEVAALRQKPGWTTAGDVLLHWVVELCDNGTRYKEDLAFGTINEYIFIVAKPLFEQARDTNFLVLGEGYFEHLYVRMASYSNRKAPFYIVDRIREFHSFCVSKFGIPDVDWNPIYSEVASTHRLNKRQKANANVVSILEYRAALAVLVDNANRATLHECQQGFCLMMAYRFGLRIDEVFSLLERQVRINDAQDVIYVSLEANSYGDGKSKSFSRNIPLLTELDEVEVDIFCRVIGAAEVQQKETKNSVFLMAREGSSRELLDKAKISKVVNQCLKNVTGDKTVTFHHLRHSWATAFGAVVLEMIEGKSSCFVDNFKQGDVFHKDRMWRLQRSDKPTIDGICKILGHANINTFIASYLHCLEYGQSDLELPNNRKLTYRAIAQILGTSDAVLRKRESRLDKGKINSIFPLSVREFKMFPVANLETSKTPIKYGNIGHEESAEIGLTRLNRVLLDYWQERDHQDEANVSSIIEQAKDLEIRTGYESYQLINIGDRGSLEKDIFVNRVENKRFNQYISSIKNDIGGEAFLRDQMLHNFTEIWAWGYCAGKSYYLLRSINELSTIREGLARLRMVGASVELVVGSDNHKKRLEALGSINAKIKTLASFPPPQIKSRGARHEVVGVRFSGLPASIKTMGTFHRLLFVLSVYLSLPKM